MNLAKYRRKHVKVTSVEGYVVIGFVDVYTNELNDPDGIENICVIPYNLPHFGKGELVGLYKPDIAKIEIIEPIEIMIYPKTYQPQAVAMV